MRRLVAAIALLLVPAPALGYVFLQRNGLPMRWNQTTIQYYQEVSEAPAGIPPLIDAAFETWEALDSVTLVFTKAGEGTTGLNRGFVGDGLSVVSYGDAGDDLGSGVLAAAVDFDDGTHAGPAGTHATIVESDIVFNDGVEFTDSEGASLSSGCIPQVSGRFDAEAVALHEIGHLVGLGHPGDQSYESAIMYPSISDCDPNRTNPRQDDIDGATFLYPSGSTPVYPGFTVGEEEGYAPHSVTFTDVSSGPVTSRQWEFGDGGTSTEQNPTHVYEAPGSYTVRLTVNGSASSEINDAVVVYERPEPDFAADVVSGDPPLVVNFDNLTPNAAGLTWRWEFGDGAGSSQAEPSHTYQEEGFYTVELWANAGPGWVVESKTRYLKVGNPGADEPLIPGCECRVASRRPSVGAALLAFGALIAVARRRPPI